MNLLAMLNLYLTSNLLIAAAFIVLSLSSLFLKWSGYRLKARDELRLHQASLLIVASFVIALPFLPGRTFFAPPAKIWAAQVPSGKNREISLNKLRIQTPIGQTNAELSSVAGTALVLLTVVCLAFFLRLTREVRKLGLIARHSHLIRRIGRVELRLHDQASVPFSFWLPRRAVVIVPESLLSHGPNLKTAIIHELQHHRQRDTAWVYAFWAINAICPLNPIAHLWGRNISEIQEFACDETLVDRKKVSPQGYACCLVEAAQSALNQKGHPVCATGMLLLKDRKLLTRRISHMLNPQHKPLGLRNAVFLAAGVTIALGATAFAAKNLIQDRRISITDARAMAARAERQSDFPIVVNDQVVAQLNHFLGTPEGREFTKNALARMENYKPALAKVLEKYRLPQELLAIPMIESGYVNLSQSEAHTPQHAAGLWQVIPSTAISFGLNVDGVVDERIDVDKESDAALRLLGSDFLRFEDWQLAVLAYNAGERAVQEGIDKSHSRDAWTLIAQGVENDQNYLAKVMAAVLIMKNPESIKQ